jgi:hypothetical protein
MIKILKSLPRWFWCFTFVVFVAGNISGVVILCSVVDLMAGK